MSEAMLIREMNALLRKCENAEGVFVNGAPVLPSGRGVVNGIKAAIRVVEDAFAAERKRAARSATKAIRGGGR